MNQDKELVIPGVSNQTLKAAGMKKRPNPKSIDIGSIASRVREIQSLDKPSDEAELDPSHARKLTDSSNYEDEEKLAIVDLELKSGRKVQFYRVFIPNTALSTYVRIDPVINTRLQEDLSENNTSKLSDSLRKGQLTDCYGDMSEDGVIDCWDGSRRTFAAIPANVGLWYRVPVDGTKEISTKDKMAIADESHLYEKLSPRDRANKYKRLMTEYQYSLKDLAIQFECNVSSVYRDLATLTVRADIIRLFNVINEISYRDYNTLLSIQKSLEAKYPEEERLAEYISELQIKPGTRKEEVIEYLQEALPKPVTKSKQKDPCTVKIGKSGNATFSVVGLDKPQLTLIEQYIRALIESN
jgi:hypothetical protein